MERELEIPQKTTGLLNVRRTENRDGSKVDYLILKYQNSQKKKLRKN